ncbi:MAG: response regulator [Lachnospiraceae bacterium]|nr:response regulator [Lachnospiraceae bacterium]
MIFIMENKIKVFLVEDEYVVREGIKNKIDWEGNGYEFVGEAGDGELALPMIQKLKPDIVITDIRMPFMDGLELSRLIKKEFPWMEIVILSGYAEFDYAKQAISIGVAHYLTKPINSEDLLSQINSLAERIEEKKQERKLKEKYIAEMAENRMEERRDLFRHMATGDMSLSGIIELARQQGIDISAGQYNILLFQVISGHHSQTEYSGSVVSIYEKAVDIAESENALVFDRSIEGKAIVFRADSKEEIEKIRENVTSRIEELVSEYEHVALHGGIGLPVARLTELPECFRQASQAYAHRFFTKKSGIRIFAPAEHNAEETFSLSSVDPNKISRNRIIEFLRTGQKDEVEFFMDEFIEGFGEGALKSAMFRQYLATEYYFAVSTFVEEIGGDRSETQAFDMAAGDIRDKDSTRDYFIKLTATAMDIRDAGAGNRNKSVIDEAKKYIDENYSDEELSLNKLASHVNFSPNHLSAVFSAQTGMTFIKYLTDYRMNKAKEMLRCTSKRGSDISYEVGYKDPHYFSYLFKRTQGVTPTQYRNGQGGPDHGQA